MNTNAQGFTLVEILVSVVIVSMLSVFIVQTFFTTVRTSTKTEVLKEVKQNGDFAIDVMTRMIQNAQSIVSCSANQIQIINPDRLSTVFSSVTDSSLCRIASNSGLLNAGFLTNENVTLVGGSCPTSLVFTCGMIGNTYTTIGVSYTIKQVTGGTGATGFDVAQADFQTAIQLRNVQY